MAVYGVLFTDYNLPVTRDGEGQRDHVFTGIQRDFRAFTNEHIFGVKSSDPSIRESPETTDPKR